MLKQTAVGIQRNDRSHAHFIIALEFFSLSFLDGAKKRDSRMRFEVVSLCGLALFLPIGALAMGWGGGGWLIFFAPCQTSGTDAAQK